MTKDDKLTIFVIYYACELYNIAQVNITFVLYKIFLSIESHFVGVHGPYESHRKEKLIFMHRVNIDKMRFNTYIHIFLHNKVCRDVAYFNTKMSYLSGFKRTKSKILKWTQGKAF